MTVASAGLPATDPVFVTVGRALGATAVAPGQAIARGELRVIVMGVDAPFEPRSIPPGEVVVVLADVADPARGEAAVARLARGVAGIVDAVGEASRWVSREEALAQPEAAGLAAARAVARVYTLTSDARRSVDATLPPRTPEILRVALTGARPGDEASPDPRLRAEAARMRDDAARALVSDPDPAVRIAAAARLAENAAADAPALLDRLARDPEPLVRARAAQASDSVARLDRLLDDPSSVVRVVAAHALASIGAEAQLLRAASHPDNYVRWKAAWGLRNTEVLIRLLADEDCDVRREAARSLGRARGDVAARVALEGALRDANSFVRRWAAEALGELGSADAVPALRVAALDDTALVAASARAALARLLAEESSPPVQPPAPPRDDAALRAMLESADGTLRKDAAKFAATRAGARALLAPLIRDPDSEVRKTAVEALGRALVSGAASREDDAAWEALVAALDDVDPDTRITALDALRVAGRVPPGARARVAALARAADTESRIRALEALAADPETPVALLEAGVSDPDERSRAAVAARLRRHAPGEPSVLVRRAATEPGVPSAAPLEAHDAWATGFLAREDDLLHLRFSWNRAEDRPQSHRALRPPVLRAYGHPDRG